MDWLIAQVDTDRYLRARPDGEGKGATLTMAFLSPFILAHRRVAFAARRDGCSNDSRMPNGCRSRSINNRGRLVRQWRGAVYGSEQID